MVLQVSSSQSVALYIVNRAVRHIPNEGDNQDFTEVDHNVTRNVSPELERHDWNGMILHYLGLDHIGHKTGPKGRVYCEVGGDETC